MRVWNPPKTPGQNALAEARFIQDEAAKLGFDWAEIGPVWDKLAEEIEELRDAIDSGDAKAISHEFGDVVFTLVNMSRFLQLDPDDSLKSTSLRFRQRLSKVQAQLDQQGRGWEEASLSELEALWQRAKQQEGV